MGLIKNKILSSFMVLCLAVSCSSPNHSSTIIVEDKLAVTRRYIGDFLAYRSTAADKFGNPDLIWITTTGDSLHSKISVYSRECSFMVGDRLYLRRTGDNNTKEEGWVYMIENDQSVRYMINEYRNHRDMPVESWFNMYPDAALPTGDAVQEQVTGTLQNH